MLSRHAETVYWAARYVERAENTARLVEVNSILMYDLPPRAFRGWGPLVRIVGMDQEFVSRYDSADEASVARFLLSDRESPSSVLACLDRARENLRTVRDIVPRSAWEQLNSFTLDMRRRAERGLSRSGRNEFTERVKLGCQQHVGVLTGTLSSNHAHRFILLGRRLERADMVTRLLEAQAELPSGPDPELEQFRLAQWRSVLRSVSGFHMYRLQERAGTQGSRVLRFLLQDPDFPRSVVRCLVAFEEVLRALPNHRSAMRAVREATRLARGARTRALEGERLASLMDRLQVRFAEVHRKLEETYFHPETRA